jgi:hypothetical protein
MIVKIYIGENQIELQKDESISITSSVLDIQDITKNTTDYSRAFTVPASEANNKTFKHYYDANIDNTFDARIKVDGRIEIDGIVFRIGKLLLQKVNVKQGKPTSYTINFYGNLVSISDALGKDELSKLDLSEFDHDYNSDNVKLGLTTSLSDGNVVYTLLAKKQYYYNSDTGDTTQTDSLSNIAYNGTASNGIEWDDLSPSLKLIKIIEAIETDYSLTFSRHFFGRAEFQNLFLWLNNSKDESVGGGQLRVDFNGGDSDNVNFVTDVGTFPTFNTSASNDQIYWDIALNVYVPDISNAGKKITVLFINNDNDEVLFEQELTLINLFGSLTATTGYQRFTHNGVPAGIIYNLRFEVRSATEISFSTALYQQKKGWQTANYTTTSTPQSISSTADISQNVPKIETLAFLKGLFQAFKLVVIPQMDGTIYVNTLKDYYAEGSLFDITSYIDFETYDVERGNILNTISYKFQDPQTILNKQFKENTGQAYGDELAILKDDNGVVLDGESSTIELPFEQVVYERLPDLTSGEITNISYGAIIDDKLEAVNPKTHIFYNILQPINDNHVGFIQDTGVKVSLTGNINTSFHSMTDTNSEYAFLFSEEYSTWNGEKLSNNLYTNYHQQYINNIFNIKRRNFTFIAKILPLAILSKLKLNDILQIKDNYYRIDKFTTDIITGKTEFNLVNAFDFTLNSFSTQTDSIYLTKEAQSYSAYVTNLSDYTVTKIDSGYGIGWLTVTDDGNLVFMATGNTDGYNRDIFVKVVKNETLQEILFYINQDGGLITFDITNLTMDSTLITFDNG